MTTEQKLSQVIDTRTIKLSGDTGAEALVDAEDYDKLSTHAWFLNYNGYARNSKRGYMHRVVLDAPKGSMVDHINRNKLDNRKSNLRFVDKTMNMHNTDSTSSVSGTRGVHRVGGKWVARVQHRGKSEHLGYFFDKYLAKEVYDQRLQEILEDEEPELKGVV